MSDPVEDLADADADYRELREEIREIGEDRVEATAEAFREFLDLLDRYEGRATGSGAEEFRAYVEFQSELEAFVDGLDEDLLERGAFEDAEETLDRRRLEERDFERARDALEPAGRLQELLEERETARERYREARRAVRRRLREREERIDDLEEVAAFRDVDLDAPVEELREPIAGYNDAVRSAFRSFKREAPAREVIAFVDATRAYPLVPYRPVPEDLREFVDGAVGDEPVPTLLEYAEYSRSKLEHYVDDPASFRGHVAANRTYLERLDADPLTVAWPPPPAPELRWRIRELIAVVDRFADEPVVERLHDLRELTRGDAYGRLREAARARERLDEGTRERLASGAVERELEALREERDRLADVLEEYPER